MSLIDREEVWIESETGVRELGETCGKGATGWT